MTVSRQSLPKRSSRAPAFIDRRTQKLRRRLYKVLFAGMIDMNFATVRRHVILLEILAFEMVILAIWMNEYWDLPHMLYGLPESKFYWQASLIETIWVLLVMGFVIVITLVFFKQIRYLEGFLPVCSFCKMIRLDDGTWVPIEQYLHERSDVRMTHSLCPACAKKHYDYDSSDEHR